MLGSALSCPQVSELNSPERSVRTECEERGIHAAESPDLPTHVLPSESFIPFHPSAA